MTEGIPVEVERFILDNINSVEQLEVLLLLRETAPKDWTADAVARELRIAALSAARRLADLRGRGLLTVASESEQSYRFAPADRKNEQIVAALADTYATRRVSVITLIFSKPNQAVRFFADAFKIRNEDDNG